MAHTSRWITHVALFVAGPSLACGTDAGDSPFVTGDGAETGTSTAGESGPGTSAGETGEDDPGTKFDTPAGDGGGPCGCGTDEWSQLWFAEAKQGYVVKLDTRTKAEQGRYLTRPDGMGDPSRTSVSLSGRRVAVANRAGGIVAIWADPKFCGDHNGVPGIQTSEGPDELLPWGEDDCVAWYQPFPEFTTQRPVAWAPGELDEDSCEYVDETLWTAGCGGGNEPSQGNGGMGIKAYRLDGDNGEVLDSVELNDFPCGHWGPYGGAVDSKGNFWIVSMDNALARVDAETLETRVYDELYPPLQPYGITVDSKDRPWVTSYSEYSYTELNGMVAPAYGAGRFDPETETWDYVEEPFASQSGISESADGKMWMATNHLSDTGWMVQNGGTGGSKPTGFLWVDRDTLEVGNFWQLPIWLKGMSVDKDGYVWGTGWTVGNGVHRALKIDPDTGNYESFDDVDQPYTYSDMTGSGIQSVACKPEG